MADLDRFKRAREKTAFIEDANSDVKVAEPKTKKITTRNKSEVELESNTLSNRERSRTKQGRNITVPLFPEELKAIEAAVSKLSELGDTSINAFIRETILAKCEKVIGKEYYKSIISDKFNVVKNK